MSGGRNPDILFITAHDIGRHLGCYGVREVESGSIDGLAASGLRFENLHSTAPQCSPSRASYMTGWYPHQTGVLGICSPAYGFDLSPGVRHFSDYLRELGYYRHGLGEVHETLQPERYFERYDPMFMNGVRAAATNRLVEEARSLLLSAPREDRPLYLQVGFREAHRPFRAAEYRKKGVRLPPWLRHEESALAELARFQESIRVLDAGVGALLEALEQSPRAEDTLVVFLADHGIPFPRAKHTLYEAGCEAAGIVRWPARGWTGGRSIGAAVSGIDLMPTLLAALGVETPDLPGRNLCGVLDGEVSARSVDIFTEQNYHVYLDASRAMRRGRYKLIANFSPGRAFFDASQSWRPATRLIGTGDAARTMHHPFELYDLEDDPLEQHDLSSDPDHSATFADMKTTLLGWMEETDDPLLTGLPEPPFYRTTLASLHTQQEDN